MLTAIQVWHLEMTQEDDSAAPISSLKGSSLKGSSSKGYDLHLIENSLPELNRFLYVAVGAKWQWYMRLGWSYAEWTNFLSKPETQTWVAYRNGVPIGYFELERQANQSTEICYFGLLPEFIGQGYGRPLLEDAIRCAWALGGKRVWLHTCSLDHPRALPNYLARGFKVFKQEKINEEIPDEAIEPWPGAKKPE